MTNYPERVWKGEFAEHEVPKKFMGVRVRKDGVPDRRCGLSEEFALYMRSQELLLAHSLDVVSKYAVAS